MLCYAVAFIVFKMDIIKACSSFPVSKCKRVYLLFLLLCVASVFGKTPDSLNLMNYEEGTMISTELDTMMMSAGNCTDELKNKCHTKFIGNYCSVDENDYFNCTCNAVGFEAAKNGKSCTQVNCSSNDNSRCRTDIYGNSCVYNGFVSQCICNAEGFIETNRRTQCLRSYCTHEEASMCLTEYGNDCVISNEENECSCYGLFEITNNGSHCKRINCTEEEAASCHTEYSHNKCYVLDGGEPSCYCHNGYIVKDNGTRCQKIKCSDEDMRRCQTNNNGNKCTFIDDDYECQCDNYEFKLSTDKKVCLDIECSFDYIRACEVSWETENVCNMTDVDDYLCICKPPFSVLSTDSRSCLRVECTIAEKKRCDPFDEGNSCYISDKWRTPESECNCTSPNSVYSRGTRRKCLSKLCGDFKDKIACKIDIDGNTCAYPDGIRRICTCNAPGYKLVSSSLRDGAYNDTCWRYECTSYEKEACQTLITGNTCRVVDDIHKCTCNAPGYVAEPLKIQRCLDKRDISRHTTHRPIDE